MEAGRPRAARPAARSTAIVELAREASTLGLVLSEHAIARFRIYLDTLLMWRQRLSLTAAATPLEVVRSHILDSLAPWKFVQPGYRLVDLGSGAGFPGIPLAIICEQSHVTLVESRRKKANFLRAVIRATGLKNVEVIEARAEVLVQQAAVPWDIVVSRAVWRLPEFLAISGRLL
jgi:16S rRNA (guanine527-N7)-methyltransferase